MLASHFRNLRAHLKPIIRGHNFVRRQTEPQRYAMDHLFLYSCLFRRSQTFLGRLSTHELRVWLNTLYNTQAKLGYQTDITFSEASVTFQAMKSKQDKEKIHTHDFVGVPLPQNLRLLQPSAEKQLPASGIMKTPCSCHVDESAVCSKQTRHVVWGECQVQHIDRIGFRLTRQKSNAGRHEFRKKRLLLQHVLEKDAAFFVQQLSSDPRSATELLWHEAKKLFVKLVMHLPSVEDVIRGILQHKPNLELHHASCVLLAERRLDFQLRLFIHEYLALTEFYQESAAYHADIALELVLKASDIPFGELCKRNKNNLAVNSAIEADLPEELKNARKILQLANQGQRVYVHWKRLAEDSEAQRIYIENSLYNEMAHEDTSDQEIISYSIETVTRSKPEDVNNVMIKQNLKPSESPLSLVRLMGR